MRVVIIGTGYGANVHLPLIEARDDLELVGLCDSGSGKAATLISGSQLAFSDWRLALNYLGAGAVIVATPPLVQQPIVESAIERGLHVLCEKPATMSAASARELGAKARSQGVVCGVGFQFRFEPELLRLRERIQGEALGSLRTIEVQWHSGGRADPDPPLDWRHRTSSGGGVLFSHMSHVFDLVHWLGAGEIIHIGGESAIRIPTRREKDGDLVSIDAEDFVLCRFATASGVVGTGSVGNSQPGGAGLRITVLGSDGVAIFSHQPPFRAEDQRLEIRARGGNALVTTGDEWPGVDRRGDTRAVAGARLLDLFVGAIHGRHEPELPTFEDAAAALDVIDRLRADCSTKTRVPGGGRLT